MLETAPKWHSGHHRFVRRGRKLRYKDMGTVTSLASGHIRISDLFCLNLDSPWHMQCPAGGRLLRRKERDTEAENQDGSVKPGVYNVK